MQYLPVLRWWWWRISPCARSQWGWSWEIGHILLRGPRVQVRVLNTVEWQGRFGNASRGHMRIVLKVLDARCPLPRLSWFEFRHEVVQIIGLGRAGSGGIGGSGRRVFVVWGTVVFVAAGVRAGQIPNGIVAPLDRVVRVARIRPRVIRRPSHLTPSVLVQGLQVTGGVRSGGGC